MTNINIYRCVKSDIDIRFPSINITFHTPINLNIGIVTLLLLKLSVANVKKGVYVIPNNLDYTKTAMFANQFYLYTCVYIYLFIFSILVIHFLQFYKDSSYI